MKYNLTKKLHMKREATFFLLLKGVDLNSYKRIYNYISFKVRFTNFTII